MPYSNTFGVPVPPQGLDPNTFGSLAGAGASQTILTPYDLYTPQELTTLYYEHKKRSPGMAMLLRNSGFTRGVKAPTTGHYEKPWNRDQLVIGSSNAAGGTTCTITLAASSMYTVPGTTIRGSYPIPGEIYELPNRKQFWIVSKDTSVNPHTVFVRSIDSTVTLDAGDFVADQRVFHIANARGEGTQLNVGKQPRVVKYTNTFQNFNSSVSSTGSDLTNKPYFDIVRGADGAPTGSYFALGLEDVMFNHEEDKDNILLFGRQTANAALTEVPPLLGYDVPILGTEGLIEFGLTAGYDEPWDPAVGYTIQDFDDIFAIYEGERVSNELMVWQGFRIYQNIENLLVDYVKQTLVSFVDESGQGFTVNVDIYGINKSGYNVTFKKLDAFNSVKGAATPGYDYPSWQIFTPWGMRNSGNGEDKVGFLGYEWKALNGYNRENLVVKLDGTGYSSGLASFTDDIYQCGLRSEIAAHFACANAIVIQRPQ